MAEPHVISGLVAKRSELAGLIEHYMQEIKRMGADLKHLDAAIQLFDPDYNLRTIRTKQYRRKNAHFKPGECARLVLDTLREAGPVLATDVVALAIIEKKGLDSADAEQVKFVKRAAVTALRHLTNRGLVKDSGLAPDGITLRWTLAARSTTL